MSHLAARPLHTLAYRSHTITAQPLRLILRRNMASSSSSSSSSPVRVPGPIVSVQWLKANYSQVKVLDGSWYMPNEKQDGRANFLAAHLPSARFFDLEACTSKEGSNADLPHMLPSGAQLSSYLASLAVSPSDAVVVYDGKGIFSAPRIRFTLNHFGMDNVAILEGGIKAWKAQGGELESGESKAVEAAAAATASSSAAAAGAPAPLVAAPGVVRSMADVASNVSKAQFQLVDARSAGRFAGSDPEPRPDIPSGHVAGANNVPFMHLLTTDEKSGASQDAHTNRGSKAKELVLDCTRVRLHLDSLLLLLLLFFVCASFQLCSVLWLSWSLCSLPAESMLVLRSLWWPRVGPA